MSFTQRPRYLHQANDYLASFEVQQVGSSEHQEYWIPAERLDDFNDAIVNLIEVISEWRAESEPNRPL